MATQATFQAIALARIESAKILLAGQDWQGSAYIMGLALECALKAAICKTLHIPVYPETHKDEKVPPFFMTHSFERLLLLSGLSDIFSTTGDTPQAFDNWSNFTIQYPGEWTFLRYTDPKAPRFEESTVKKLFEYLYNTDESIIKTIDQNARW